MLDELLTQLQMLSASGLEAAGAGDAAADETDTEEDEPP
jgi:hypothetical protein